VKHGGDSIYANPSAFGRILPLNISYSGILIIGLNQYTFVWWIFRTIFDAFDFGYQVQKAEVSVLQCWDAWRADNILFFIPLPSVPSVS